MLGLEAFMILAAYTSMVLAAPTKTGIKLPSFLRPFDNNGCYEGYWHWVHQDLSVCIPIMPIEMDGDWKVKPPEPFECPKGWYWAEYPKYFHHCVPANNRVFIYSCPPGYRWHEHLIACERGEPELHNFFPMENDLRKD